VAAVHAEQSPTPAPMPPTPATRRQPPTQVPTPGPAMAAVEEGRQGRHPRKLQEYTLQQELSAKAALEDSGIDVNNDKKVSKEEFKTMPDRPDAFAAFEALGVDLSDINLVAELIYVKMTQEWTFAELTTKLLDARNIINIAKSDTNPTLPPTPAPRDWGVNEKGEWIMLRYKGPNQKTNSDVPDYYTTAAPEREDECYDEFTGVGAQQSWRRLTGAGTHCFTITSQLQLAESCRASCTAKVFCSRGGNSGVKIQFYKGDNCLSEMAEEMHFMPQLTWPELHGFLYGTCTEREDGYFEKFITPWNVGSDFPNCYGYDFSTQGAGVVTEDPKDSPYTLSTFSDIECTQPYIPDGTNPNASGQPIWMTQRWMSALRKVEEKKRTSNLEHCWIIELGAPPMTFFGSIKLVCDHRELTRMMMYVHHYEDETCSGGIGGVAKEKETFYEKMGYEELANGIGDVEEVSKFFKGQCAKFGGNPTVYWKWDRPVHGEDWPDCYAEAIANDIRVRRPSMSDLDYSGSINTIRAKTGGATGHGVGVGVLLSLLIGTSA